MTETVLLRRRIATGSTFAVATGVFAIILLAIATQLVTQVAELPAGSLDARIRSLSPMPLPLALQAALAVIALAALGAVAGLLLHRLRLDPVNRVGASLAWAWRALLAAWPVTVAIAVAVAILHLVTDLPVGYRDLPSGLVLYIFAFGIFTPRTASSAVATRWWMPQSPGWRSLAAVVALGAAWLGWKLAMNAFSARIDEGDGLPWRATLVDLGAGAVAELFTLAIASLLVLRWQPSDLPRSSRELLRRDVLAAWFVGAVVLLVLSLPVHLLQTATMLYDVSIRPQVDFNTAERPEVASLAHWNYVARALGTFAASVFALLALFSWLTRARLVHLMLAQTPRDSGSSDATGTTLPASA